LGLADGVFVAAIFLAGVLALAALVAFFMEAFLSMLTVCTFSLSLPFNLDR
jgi:hypothetical protein